MEYTYSLEDLLSADVLQTHVEILDAGSNVLELVLVAALEGRGLSDGQVERQADAAVLVAGGQPACVAAVGRGRKAELVLSRLGGGKSETTAAAALLRDDAVVVVEGFLRKRSVRRHVRERERERVEQS